VDAGLNFAYVPFRVKAEDVGQAVGAIRALHIRGLNVTIPHKLAVIPYLDRVDRIARRIGAVNTIVNDEGILTGFNTDASGFIRPLLERGLELRNKRVLVIGAGGAARAIASTLADQGAQIMILNRTAERARALAESIGREFGGEIGADELSDKRLAAGIEKADLVVNTTSVGMASEKGQSPVPSKLLRKGLTVYDIVYNPIRTGLLTDAEAAGCITVGGTEMLAWQGALAFEMWTGRKAPIDLMKGEVVRSLSREE
jgi:shikimate dehydrogenase